MEDTKHIYYEDYPHAKKNRTFSLCRDRGLLFMLFHLLRMWKFRSIGAPIPKWAVL